MTTEPPPGLPDLVLARLAAKDAADGLTVTKLHTDLGTLIERHRDAATGHAWLDETVAGLHAEDQLTRTRPKRADRLGLTVAGRHRAHRFLGARGPLNTTWDRLRKGRLVARALGVEVDDRALANLITANGLRAQLLNQHYRLELPPGSTTKQVEDELGWRLLARGADPAAIAAARRTGGFNVTHIKTVLMYTAAGLKSAVQPSSRLAVLAAKVTGARNTGHAELVATVLDRLLADPPATAPAAAAAPPTDQPATAPTTPTDHTAASFVDRVLDAARRTRDGRLGTRLVLISHVWRTYTEESGDSVDLETFKAWLLAAHRARELYLATADMPQSFDPAELRASTIEWDESRLSLVRL